MIKYHELRCAKLAAAPRGMKILYDLNFQIRVLPFKSIG